jgi:hypothetical protein
LKIPVRLKGEIKIKRDASPIVSPSLSALSGVVSLFK